jgi:hypothetical protein
MGDPVKKITGSGSDVRVAEPLPPLKPGRQVGWIFKDGEVVAIERHECEVRDAARQTARHAEDAG